MIAALLLSLLSVTTSVPQAQAQFARGLALLYAYSGEAADDAFTAALRADPHLAMAQWGRALAAGSDLNTPITPERFAKAHDAAIAAAALEPFASPHERAYIDAVAARYAGTWDDRGTDNERYAAAMAALVQAYPRDDDGLMLDAEALMENNIADAHARELIAIVLARNPDQVMANHLCIHSYDYAADHTPALPCANRLAQRNFDADELHLAHMPAHTYIVTGHYAQALAVTERAWQLRERAVEPHKYAAHDAYTGWSTAMMLGDLQTALVWAGRAGAAYDGSDVWATYARFAQWDRISGPPRPREFYAALARGLADIHRGDDAGARSMLALYRNTDADYRWILQAAVDEHANEIDDAAAALQRAIDYQQREDVGEQLPLFPAGEYLGALYFRHARYGDAARAYTETLARFPDDPRALYGLSLAQRALGQTASAAQTLKVFSSIWNAAQPPSLVY